MLFVTKQVENLRDYVRRVRREKGLSTTEVERRSGRKISDAYVTKIENDESLKNVSPGENSPP